jgi:hypothetical protein
MRLIVAVALLFFFQKSGAQPDESVVIKDLKPEWKVLSNNQYLEYDQSTFIPTIYFIIDPNLFGGASLRIESEKYFSVFINGKIMESQTKGVQLYNIDSLASLYSNPLNVSIRRQKVALSTKLVIKNGGADDTNLFFRQGLFFLDFSILAFIFLLIFFVVLLRINPKLTFDYLNFASLFSRQELEENVMVLRIRSRANLLYYAFASLLSALQLMIVFHFVPSQSGLANMFHGNSLKECFYQWVGLSAIILGILFAKLILTTTLSYLFKSTEFAALQFFNFIRLIIFTFGIISLVLIFYFVIKVTDPTWYYNLFYFIATVFIIWEIVIFLKLMARVHFHFFHLFLYLCVSEFIPLVILLKVVFY